MKIKIEGKTVNEDEIVQCFSARVIKFEVFSLLSFAGEAINQECLSQLLMKNFVNHQLSNFSTLNRKIQFR
jgi:hypothetical protein